ncbi:MAG: hypothetical protein E5W70_02080 [Mesorhizobium sp.]|nr:MAG: hypothetical protein E5W70_02080 [Mesorhizobium sp.]
MSKFMALTRMKRDAAIGSDGRAGSVTAVVDWEQQQCAGRSCARQSAGSIWIDAGVLPVPVEFQDQRVLRFRMADVRDNAQINSMTAQP